jgi:hypothetical protein
MKYGEEKKKVESKVTFCIWLMNDSLVCHTEGGTWGEDVREWGAEGDVWV